MLYLISWCPESFHDLWCISLKDIVVLRWDLVPVILATDLAKITDISECM